MLFISVLQLPVHTWACYETRNQTWNFARVCKHLSWNICLRLWKDLWNLLHSSFNSQFLRGFQQREVSLTLMGVLAPGSAHASPSVWPPISMSGNFPAHMSVTSPSNISPTPQESYPNFWNTRTTFENTPPVRPKMSYFCELGAHETFRNSTTTPSGILITAARNIKKKKE